MARFDQVSDAPRKGRIIKSAYDSESFESDGTIHVDGLVGSATISPSGRDIALASPDGLAIIDLDSPYNPPRRLRSHGLPWLVCDVQWSPFAARDYWVVSTANHDALVWNLNLSEDSNSGAIEHSLKGHTRAITDINFSAHHPDLLATCSVDGYVHWWDLRRPRQPVLTFCDWFAGATQVKFNRQDPHILASAHDRWLHIWDERRACEPLKSISAHNSKIYGIDWNRIRSTGIVTCSLDKTIKFWDYSKGEDVLEHVICTDFPVWRARHTPFGWGLLAMPQNEPGNLYLYDRLWADDSPVEVTPNPVAVFSGHGDHKAKEFLWRTRGAVLDDIDHREFQLVSWGTDNELRLHCVDSNALSSVGHVKDGSARKGLSLTRQGATYKTFRTVDDGSNRDRKTGTMSDHRSGTSTPHRKQSALTLGMRSGTLLDRQVRPPWRGPSMKANAGPRQSMDRSQAQLGWMRGITMTKRKSSIDGSSRFGSKDASIVGHDYPEDDWGQPDTIQEELLRVSTKIPKVKWENIDMDNLTLNASLTGPWGADEEPIFIKVKIDIPAGYPKLKAPTFFIEKTSFMPEETQKKIEREMHQVAEQFLQRKQNCLEVAFTYLLGEVDLESSTTFFKNVRDLDDDLDGMADESSSEEDEDILAGGSASMSQELGPHGDIDNILAPPSRSIIPPTPRTCGARFSNDGRLACFFPSKEEKARALFSTSAELYSKERARGEPFFAGFGRLSYDLPQGHKLANDEASATEEALDSSDSDVSSSSTDSESTSIHKLSVWYHPSRQLRKTWSEDLSVRSSGGGTGAGTGTGTGTSRRRYGKPRNLVYVHDLRAELPSKSEFAGEYAVFGDGADVCEHNARVAETHGIADLAHVWRYLALLLKKGVPLEVLHNEGRPSILVTARDAVARCHDEPLDANHSLLGRVKWGQHPLARGFIVDLFEHFEKAADVQMLAMLSCIFSEPSTDDGVAYVKSRLTQRDMPLPFKAPCFSLDYLPMEASAWGLYSQSHSNSAITTPGTLHTPVFYGGSQASEDLTWTGEPGTGSFSCGETPPSKSRSLLADHDLQPSPMSRSPTSRGILRGNSTLASALTANLPRSFTGGSSSSPPGQGKKKPSPVEYIINTLAPGTGNATQGSSSGMADSGGGAGTSISDEDPRKDDRLPLVPVNVSVVVEDQTIFDDDGWLSTPLLDAGRASNMHPHYRYAYAEMLQMWGQPLARLEVMKFNVLEDQPASGAAEGSFHDSMTIQDGASGSVTHPKADSSPIIMGRRDQLQTLLASGRGLDVTGICRVHETQLEPARYTSSEPNMGGAVGTCERCHRSQTQLRCVYCLEPVDALFTSCLACGCASHEGCLAEWHAAGETLCPAGDECNCVDEASNGQVESWVALQGAMLKGLQQARNNSQSTLLPAPVSDDDGRRERERERERAVGDAVDRLPAPTSRVQVTRQSPTSLSFGRLKKSASAWSRAPSLRRASGRGG
ncbi:hypothetical protein XA68_10605 [Ophiocordyceps unilateralis]|uniref:WDR59/RTC1-like RING zinc finger domain-containing protein n=1 Tax=Ophiocordyceps unilateralis TaxID=268505 RepID=A0A2A9PGM3_OPHUN|nr:hypothetical protein XA68_10605 [Ophiocordyceps unilateralis]